MKSKLPRRVIIHWALMKYLLSAMLKGRIDVYSLLKEMASPKQKLIQGGPVSCVTQIRLGDP